MTAPGRDPCPLTSWDKIFESEEVQTWLASARRDGVRPRCACGLELTIFFWPPRRKFSVRRRSRDGHENCWTCRPSDAWARLAGEDYRYPPSILLCDDDSEVEDPVAVSVAARESASGVRYERFTHYCNGLMLAAWQRAFAAVNQGLTRYGPLRNPTESEFLDQFEMEVGQALFSDGRNARQILEPKYRGISVGLTKDPLVKCLDELGGEVQPESALTLEMDRYVGRPTMAGATIVITPDVAKRAAGRLRVWGTLFQPPHFFLVIHGRPARSRAFRLFVQPVAWDSRQVAPIESELERRVAVVLMRLCVPFVKPIRVGDHQILGPQFVGHAGQSLPLEYRPDFIVFLHGLIVLVEVAGMCDEDYRRHLEKKLAYYATLARFGVRCVVVGDSGGCRWRFWEGGIAAGLTRDSGLGPYPW